MKFEHRNEELQRQINSLKEKVNDPLHEYEFEYANIKESSHTNNTINPSSEVISNGSKLEALIPEKDTDETAWSEVDYARSTTRVSSSEPELKLGDSQAEINDRNSSEIIMPTVLTDNTRPTSGVDTEIVGRNSNAQQTELTTRINVDLINCPEQQQISKITIVPVSRRVTNPNSVPSTPLNKLNLPLIEFPSLNNNTKRKDHLNTLQAPFWQGTLSHPTRHRTDPQVRMKYIVNKRHQRMKASANEWQRYLRYVYQTTGC